MRSIRTTGINILPDGSCPSFFPHSELARYTLPWLLVNRDGVHANRGHVGNTAWRDLLCPILRPILILPIESVNK